MNSLINLYTTLLNKPVIKTLSFATLLLTGCGGNVPPEPMQTPTTTITGSMTTPRHLHTATLLNNGKVLIAGGFNLDYPGYLKNAEIYDPATGKFTATKGSMTVARAQHTATKLTDGKVLITGGVGSGNKCVSTGCETEEGYTTAEIYDHATDSFTAITSKMVRGRTAHTATLLPNGTVLIAGGEGSTSNDYYRTDKKVEIYDPITSSFSISVAPRYVSPITGLLEDIGVLYFRYGHSSTLLPNGQVISTGGSTYESAQIYDPATKIYRTVTSKFPANSLYNINNFYHTSTLLGNGKVIFIGGDLSDARGILNSAAIYNPAQDTFTVSKGLMKKQRSWHTATLLSNGKVLVIGGAPGNTSSAELYDPVTDSFSDGGAMAVGRSGHTATLLPNGKVLVTGGAAISGGDAASAELF